MFRSYKKLIPTHLNLYLRIPNWLKKLNLVAFFARSYLARFNQGKTDIIPRKDILHIAPKYIRFYLDDGFVDGKGLGLIRRGSWDLKPKKISDAPFITALVDHFERGVPWEDTAYYRELYSKINSVKTSVPGEDENALREKFTQWDGLYNEINNGGYDAKEVISEISINIGRNGELILNSGLHEFLILSHLNISSIPVYVKVRHSKWAVFQNRVFHYAQGGKPYAPLTHPDLSHVPFKRGRKRADLIIDFLEKQGVKFKTVLDIGANWGYFCHRLEERGFQCAAVEMGNLNFYFLNKLKRAQNRKFECIRESILDLESDQLFNSDIVLALSVFHHFLEDEELFGKLTLLLRNFKAKVILFESTYLNDRQMQNTYKKFASQDDLADFILENTTLSHKKLLSKEEGGRNLYALY